MTDHPRRRWSALALFALLLGLLVPLTLGGSLSTADAAAHWKCGKWHSNSSTSYRYCILVTNVKPVLAKTDDYLLHNSHAHQTVTATCSWDHSTTWSQHLDGTVKAEAGLIFEKVSAEVSSGVAHSTTDATHLGFTFKIHPHRWAWCARGHAGFNVSGRVHKQTCDSHHCSYSGKRTFSGHIPARTFIDTGDGKDINWSTYLPH